VNMGDAGPDVKALFLVGADTIVEALGSPDVVEAWDRPSVLEEQLVSGLGGHLARGCVWTVSEYLNAGTPEGPVDFKTAGEYFASFASRARAEHHRAIRDRGAAVAAAGHTELLKTLRDRLGALEPELAGVPSDRLMAVAGGRVMELEAYLTTRIVEQAVHLDDLARSVGHDPWPVPAEHTEVAIAVGVDIARLNHGSTSVLRALYRRGFAEPTLPVL